MLEKKKLIIWSLFFLTVVLGISAIYIGYKLREQPEISPSTTEAEEKIEDCTSAGFNDSFSSSALDTTKWQYVQSSPNISRTSFSNSVLTIEVDNINDADSNSAGIQNTSLLKGNFRSEVIISAPVTISNEDGPNASAGLIFVSKTNEEIFGLSRKVKFTLGVKTETITAFVNDRVIDELSIEENTSDLKLVLEKDGTKVSGFIESTKDGTVKVFEEQLSQDVTGHLRINLENIDPGIQTSKGTFTSFMLGCIETPTIASENSCTCESGFVTNDACYFNSEPECSADEVCECQAVVTSTIVETTRVPLATIVIPSNQPTTPVGTTILPTSVVSQGPFVTSANTVAPTNVNTVVITQSNVNTCNGTKNEAIVKYSIKLTNKTTTAVNLLVDTYFDSKILSEYLQTSTVSNGGAYVPTLKKITWSGLPVINVNDSLTLTYELKIPNTAFGDFSNETLVYEKEANIGSSVYAFKVSCLPSTALISDKVDRILIAICMIIAGYFMFVAGIHQYAGKLFWRAGGNRFLAFMNEDFKEEYNKEERKSFETKITDNFDD